LLQGVGLRENDPEEQTMLSGWGLDSDEDVTRDPHRRFAILLRALYIRILLICISANGYACSLGKREPISPEFPSHLVMTSSAGADRSYNSGCKGT